MSYLGNSPVLSQQEYRNIDDISGSFNGSTTSFALLVNGVAPVPAPQSSNQCLISVNGVIQKPDDTGATGFRLSGGNIIFSAAPTGGQAFFGVILAGADYIYAGQNYPDGTVSAPSITFAQDLDTGFYRSGAGEVKFTANGANTVTLSSNNLTAPSFIPTSSSAPTNGVYLPAANTVAIATNSTGKLFINSSGQVGIGTSSPGTALHLGNSSTLRINNPDGTRTLDLFNDANNAEIKSSVDPIRINAFHSSGYVRFDTNNTERVRITSAGNVGIGTTSPNSILTTKGSFITVQNSSGSNVGFIGPADNVISGGSSTDFGISTSGGSLLFGSGGTTERARIDSSGRLLVGTSSAIAALEPSIQIARPSGAFFALGRDDTSITDDETLGAIYFYGYQGSSWSNSARIAAMADAAWGTNDYPSKLVFYTTADGASSPTERMRIDSTGRTSLYSTTTGSAFQPAISATAGTASAILSGFHSATAILTGTVSVRIWSNGNIVNTNNSYGSLSDVKLKENIVNAASQWDDIKALQVRKYNFKEGQTHTQIGLIAQEVELVSPGLVYESPDRDEDGNDLGTVTKSVNYSVLYMKAVKALQEAMERIETLEAKVAALESA